MARDQLKAEAPSDGEVSRVVSLRAARLKDGKNDDLDLKSRFDLSCNASHASFLAAVSIARVRITLFGNERYEYRVELNR